MFIMRPITTFVIDVSPSVAVHVAQGPALPEWLLRGPGSQRKGTMLHGTPPKWLALRGCGAGGSSFGEYRRQGVRRCPQCLNSHGGRLLGDRRILGDAMAFRAGQVFRPADVTVSGAPTGYTFESKVVSRLLTIAAKGGPSIGPARIYGLAAPTVTRRPARTTQTIADKTVVVNNVTRTIPGGTQSFGQQTEGWDWLAGGGVEAWVNNWIAIYGEPRFRADQGEARKSEPGDGVDDQMRSASSGSGLTYRQIKTLRTADCGLEADYRTPGAG